MPNQRRLTSAVNVSSPFRGLLSFLVVGLLLVGLICPLIGGDHGLEFCFSTVSPCSFSIRTLNYGSYFARDASGRVLHSFLLTAPDRAPPPDQTILSV
jgi:hypothetical protein